METPDLSANNLLYTMNILQKVYENARKELNDVRKKLHGTPLSSWSRSSTQSVNNLVSAPILKRGRGRPRKVACNVETVDNNSSTTNNIDNLSNLGNLDNFNSGNESITPNDGVDSLTCEEIDTRDEFNGAVFTFISDEMYIETREGKFYDIYTRELRGWFNPYTQCPEWL
jgi:hypothetical protein